MFASLISGALTGTIGSIFTNVADYFKKKQEQKHLLEMKRLDIEMMDKEFEAEQRRAELNAETATETSADDLQEMSYGHDARAYSTGYQPGIVGRMLLAFVDFIRGMTRPGLTIFLIWQVYQTRSEVQAVISAAGLERIDTVQALAIYGTVVDMILFLASTAVAWWFGTRTKKK